MNREVLIPYHTLLKISIMYISYEYLSLILYLDFQNCIIYQSLMDATNMLTYAMLIFILKKSYLSNNHVNNINNDTIHIKAYLYLLFIQINL